MPPVRSQAIVLESRAFRESSLLTTLLLRQGGRIAAVARGARRPKSNLAAALQPFLIVEAQLSIRASGGLATLTAVDVLERPGFTRPNGATGGEGMMRLACAGLFAEALGSSCENDPHAEELYVLARGLFLGLGVARRPGSFAVCGCAALLGALGYLPDFAAAPQGGEAHLDLVRGVLHPAHAALHVDDFPLSSEDLDALRDIAAAPPPGVDGAAPVELRRGQGRRLMRLMLRLFEAQLERGLRSARFLEEVVLRQGEE